MNEIFISYRRSDSADITGRIWDNLTRTFGAESIFRDVDNIPLGKDFSEVISKAIDTCKVVLVIIGDDWLLVQDEDGNRRIDNPNEVKSEVEPHNPKLIELLETGISMMERLSQDNTSNEEYRAILAQVKFAKKNG